jgi:acetoin utilization deacetylase AcuC-like enzyme
MKAPLASIPVFYTPKMVAPSLSFSPSSIKPEKVVSAWQNTDIPIEIHDVVPVTVSDLAMAHDKTFVELVLAGVIDNGFDNKDADIAQTLLYTNGSMRDAAKAAIENGVVAVSPTSGFHHAHWQNASSFCTFNGLIVAAQWLFRHQLAKRIGIIDCDYHFGNGTSQIINKLDLNETIKHFTAGYFYSSASQAGEFFEKLYGVVKYMDDCDVIFYQAGADPHIDDPLGGFLTTEQMYQRDLLVFTECKQRNIPVAWNLAGGYQQHNDGSTNWDALTEIHTNTLKACWQAVSRSAP